MSFIFVVYVLDNLGQCGRCNVSSHHIRLSSWPVCMSPQCQCHLMVTCSVLSRHVFVTPIPLHTVSGGIVVTVGTCLYTSQVPRNRTE